MNNIERERVFLLKELPTDLLDCKNIIIKIGDVVSSNEASILKIRQKGDSFEMIKKEYISDFERKEYVMPLNEEEFNLLWPVTKRRHTKNRFFYPFEKYTCELDIYLEDMAGYARVEVEFEKLDELRAFQPPPWFGEEITIINHEIHEGLGEITCDIMKKRFMDRNITFAKIFLPD